jgi:hypothetical protein
MSQSGNPAAPFTMAVFAAGCIAGAGTVASCELRSSTPGECGNAYLTGMGLVIMGSVPKAANDAGFQTLNPALDPLRKDSPEAEAKTEGPPSELPPEPDWLAMDAHPGEPAQPEEVVPVWVDDAIAAAQRMTDVPLSGRETEELLRQSLRDAIVAGEVPSVGELATMPVSPVSGTEVEDMQRDAFWQADAVAPPVDEPPPPPQLTTAQRMARAAAKLPREAKS